MVTCYCLRCVLIRWWVVYLQFLQTPLSQHWLDHLDTCNLKLCCYRSVAAFGQAFREINQVYHTLMSALTAYMFRSLPDFAVGIILALLVLWNLFAVRCSWRPLGMLVIKAFERTEELPALVFATNPVSAGRKTQSTTAGAILLASKDDFELPGFSKQKFR